MKRKGAAPRGLTSGISRRVEPRLVRRLLDWYGARARDLPWRRESDPYAIWVSEIMLQQTQVNTVMPYWRRWMSRFADVRALAQADLGQVLKMWEGLGYYSRARNLQRAAKVIVDRYGGVFPTDFERILDLPGIGRYTAGAICSIAFGQPMPALDGNGVRVLTRFYGIREDPRRPRVANRLWERAAGLVQEAAETNRQAGASHFNQGLMELGATVCLPRQPQCGECPLRRGCVAYREDRTAEFPNRSKQPAPTRRHFVAVVIERDGSLLLRQRPDHGVNAHLWEFPNIELTDGLNAILALRQWLKCGSSVFQPLGIVRHAITRYQIRLEPFAVGRPARMRCPEGIWVPLGRVGDLPFPSAHKRILECYLDKSRRTVSSQA